jgi:hypothetical protein
MSTVLHDQIATDLIMVAAVAVAVVAMVAAVAIVAVVAMTTAAVTAAAEIAEGAMVAVGFQQNKGLETTMTTTVNINQED